VLTKALHVPGTSKPARSAACSARDRDDAAVGEDVLPMNEGLPGRALEVVVPRYALVEEDAAGTHERRRAGEEVRE
jgi:hypothetical protein